MKRNAIERLQLLSLTVYWYWKRTSTRERDLASREVQMYAALYPLFQLLKLISALFLILKDNKEWKQL